MSLVSRSLRLKISLGVSLVLILLLAPFNLLQYRQRQRAAIADLSQLAAITGAVAEHSLEGAMLSDDRPAVQTIVDSLAQAPDVRQVYLFDNRARVAASPGGTLNGKAMDREGPVCQGCHQFPPQSRPHSMVVTAPDGQAVFRTMTPIANQPACVGCHPAQDRFNGALYVDFSMAGLNQRLQQELLTTVLASTAIILLAALAIYALLSRLVITPVMQVGQALRRFSQGERSARAEVGAADEIGLLGSKFNEMAGTIQEQEARAGGLYAALQARDAVHRQLLGRLTDAREQERRRLARELHDELGQMLTGLSLHLQLGRQSIPDHPEKAAEHLGRARELIGETIEQSHRLVADLRPTVLDDYGLIPALREELSHSLGALGITAELDAGEDGKDGRAGLPPEVATAAFRIAQEAITNVVRHACAHRVRVAVRQAPDGVTMTVDDDGLGIPEEMATGLAAGGGGERDGRLSSLGILGMQERAEALGGRVDVSRRRPRGTRVRLWLPLDGRTA